LVTVEAVVDPDVLALCLVGLFSLGLKPLEVYDRTVASARQSDGAGERSRS
jgi:hypothetical protein